LAIDELQDDLLRQLDELERRTEAVLAECQAAVTASGDRARVGGNAAKSTPRPQQRVRKAA
jgi:hypothetical protein